MSGRQLAVIGDGRMGRAVQELAKSDGWNVTAVIGPSGNAGGAAITRDALGGAQVAIEFTEPAAAVANATGCIRAGCPVVVGTTGWYDSLPALTREAERVGGALLWAPNFSLGVNLFVEMARHAASLLGGQPSFAGRIRETHHAAKKDAPSGTASLLARAMRESSGKDVPIESVRTGLVPGTHEVIFDAPFEEIALIHTATDRRLFAAGALMAAQWLIGKQGVFTMRDVLGLADSR